MDFCVIYKLSWHIFPYVWFWCLQLAVFLKGLTFLSWTCFTGIILLGSCLIPIQYTWVLCDFRHKYHCTTLLLVQIEFSWRVPFLTLFLSLQIAVLSINVGGSLCTNGTTMCSLALIKMQLHKHWFVWGAFIYYFQWIIIDCSWLNKLLSMKHTVMVKTISTQS